MNSSRDLTIFEKYIHTNECFDECGWFAFFCPNGTANDYDWAVEHGLKSDGCSTEKGAIDTLMKLIAQKFIVTHTVVRAAQNLVDDFSEKDVARSVQNVRRLEAAVRRLPR